MFYAIVSLSFKNLHVCNLNIVSDITANPATHSVQTVRISGGKIVTTFCNPSTLVRCLSGLLREIRHREMPLIRLAMELFLNTYGVVLQQALCWHYSSEYLAVTGISHDRVVQLSEKSVNSAINLNATTSKKTKYQQRELNHCFRL